MDQLTELNKNLTSEVTANYNKLSDQIRRITPQGIQCSLFCGGNNCKYENPENWKSENLAIQGIYSHWITDDILAMARPSTIVIVQKNVIEQFKSLNIKSIINLQCPKEHASCGQPLEESGYSYNPNIFMTENIYYYNFAWKDYGEATLMGLLDMIKVLAFAIREGRVAIHCHAGLGRTGVLIACYLVYSLKVNANDAIRYVRLKRPGSVQTRGQILCVKKFAQFILPNTITFFIKDDINKVKYMTDFTLSKFLKKQNIILHGYDERNFKYLPKIIHNICERILKLCDCWTNEFTSSNIPFTFNFISNNLNKKIPHNESAYNLPSPTFTTSLINTFCDTSPNSPVHNSINIINETFSKATVSCINSIDSNDDNGDDDDDDNDDNIDNDDITNESLIENKCFQQLQTKKDINKTKKKNSFIINDIDVIKKALLLDFENIDNVKRMKVIELQNEINNLEISWHKLDVEIDLEILTSLLFEWIENLKVPIIKLDNFENIVINYNKPEICLQKFNCEEAYFMEYLLKFINKIFPVSNDNQENILKRFIAAFSKHTLMINGKLIPSGKGFKKLRDGTLNCTRKFFQLFLELINNHSYRNSNKENYESKNFQ